MESEGLLYLSQESIPSP